MNWQDEQKKVATGVTGGQKQWQSTQEKSRIETVPAQGTLLPKREWVGLNWNDLPEIYVGDTAFLHGAKWAEAKLKEKEHMKITGYCPVCVRPYFDCKCARWGNYMEKNQ